MGARWGATRWWGIFEFECDSGDDDDDDDFAIVVVVVVVVVVGCASDARQMRGGDRAMRRDATRKKRVRVVRLTDARARSR